MKEKIKTLQIIHLAITAGIVIVYFVILDKDAISNLKVPNLDSSSIVFVLIPILAILLSNFLFKSMIGKIDPKLNIEDKIGTYQTASIIRWAILEFAAFFVLFFKQEFFAFGLIVILYLLILRPTEEKFKNDLKEV